MDRDEGERADQVIEDQRRAALAAVMAGLAAGDPAALVAMIQNYRAPIAGQVRRIASARGVGLGPDEMEELVTDAALAIAEVAGGWSPSGGAAPWTWAYHQVARVVDRHIGQHRSSLDLDSLERAEGPPSRADEPPVLEVLGHLADRHEVVALLAEAVAMVAAPRDRELFFETALQAALGDRSPAKTVADAHGLTSATVRQQHCRVRRRLRQLAARDPRFATLGDLPVVA